jgi:hypothetical protein
VREEENTTIPRSGEMIGLRDLEKSLFMSSGWVLVLNRRP